MTPTEARMAQWLESAWLARYLERQLSEEESAWFEGYVLDKPQLLAAIDADSRLRDALAAETQAGGLSRSATTSADAATPIRNEPVANARTRSRLRTLSAMAASLVIGFGAASFVSKPRNPGTNNAVIGSSARVFIDLERGVVAPKNGPNDGSSNGARGKGEGSNYIILDVAVPLGSTNVKLLVDHREVSSIESATDGDATFVLQRALIASRPAVQVSYESEGRTLLRELPIDALLPTQTGQ